MTEESEGELRRRLDEQGAELERFYRAFQDAPVGMILAAVSDGAVRLRVVNEALARMTGYSAEELVGKTPLELAHPESQGATTMALNALTAGAVEGFRVERHWQRADGGDLWVELSASRLATPEGAPGEWAVHVEDVGPRREAELERDRLAAELRQADRLDSLGQLAGGVAHDFNNLLAVILTYARLLEHSIDDPQAARDLKAVTAAVESAAGLSRQLLTFSRAEPASTTGVDLDSVVERVAVLLRRTLPEAITLETVLETHGRAVLADITLMEQVVINLAINARDAMPDGGTLSISTAVVPGTDGELVELTVEDSGTGMDPEVRERAFEPFFTTKPRSRGTGLGLATVYGAVQRAGGTVSIESEVGQGTTVRITMPLHEMAARGTEVPRRTGGQGGTGTILLVEDEPWLRDALVRVLEGAGHHVEAAGSGDEAAQLVDRVGMPDVLVTDVMLPGQSGPALAQRLRLIDADLPVVLMTGHARDMAGADDVREPVEVLIKPFDVTALLDVVAALLAPG